MDVCLVIYIISVVCLLKQCTHTHRGKQQGEGFCVKGQRCGRKSKKDNSYFAFSRVYWKWKELIPFAFFLHLLLMFLTLILEQVFFFFRNHSRSVASKLYLSLPPSLPPPHGWKVSKFFRMFKEQLIADGRKRERPCFSVSTISKCFAYLVYPHFPNCV